MNKNQLVLLDDNPSDKLERKVSDGNYVENRTAPRQENRQYNPAVHLDLSQLRKHNSLVPLKKENSNIELRQIENDDAQKTDLIIVKLKNKEPTEKHTDKKMEVSHAKTVKTIDSKEKNEKKCLKKIEAFVDSTAVMITMTCFTVFALFASDIQAAWLPSSVDFSFDVIQVLLFFFFTLEIVLASIAKKDYLWSFFFWLDVVATLSLLQDISFIFDNLLTGSSSLDPPTLFNNIDEIKGSGSGSTTARNSQQASSSLQKVSSASRATRVLRIIRIIRLIRIVKLYKSAVQAREKLEKKKKEKERQKQIKEIEIEESKETAGKSVVNSEGNEENQQEAQSPEMKKLVDDNKNKIITTTPRHKEKAYIGRRLSKLNLESLSLNVNKNNQPATVVTKKKMSVKRSKTQFSESSSIESMVSESKISKLLSESLTKKVIVLILSMLIFLPVLQEDFYSNDSNNDYTILAKYIDNYWAIGGKDSFNFTDPQNPGGFYMHSIENSVDPNFPILIIKINNILWYRNSSWGEYPFRSSETRNSLSADGIVQITYSVMSDTSLSGILNMVRTIFVCVCLTTAAIYFEADARELVLQPLEIMIEIVDYVAKDPINAKNVENLNKGVKSTIQKIGKKNKNSKKEQLTEEKYEIKVIESAIIKISALLAIGFGDAGGEIIKENLSSSSELNPMLKGKKKVAIFGFCDIRNFPTVNEALQEDTMLFVNEIAEIVHSSVDRFAGAANKNIGDAFLMVWKFPPEDEIFIKKESLELDPECRAVQQTADMAVLGFLDVIIRINSDQRVLKYRSNSKIEQVLKQYQVKMGFGLHLGWAIEGAIGSSYKIDASYLSPNVNMAARLEAATRIYGVNILVSGPLFDKLSDEMKDICRLIDIVTVKGSIEPMRLYTIDLNINLTPEDPNRVFKELTEKEQRLLYKNKRDKILNEGKVCGSVPLYVLKKKRYVELLNTGRKSKFYDEWEEGFSNYIDGKWEEAAKHFNNCLSMVTSDGPCTTLLGYLKAHNYTAPAKWKGVRELTSKT